MQPPDDELYKQRAHLAECLNERLRNPDWLGIGACGEKPQQHANPGQVWWTPAAAMRPRWSKASVTSAVSRGLPSRRANRRMRSMLMTKARLARLILPTEIAAVVPSASGALAARRRM